MRWSRSWTRPTQCWCRCSPRLGLVGNRLKPHTTASQQAIEQLRGWPVPLVAQVRDSQAYVVLTGLGKSLFDYSSAQVRDHQADWQPLLDWLDHA